MLDRSVDLQPINPVTCAGALNHVIDLLANGAAAGKKIVSETTPAMTKQQYLELLRGLGSETTYRES